jgi:hypothetical protein
MVSPALGTVLSGSVAREENGLEANSGGGDVATPRVVPSFALNAPSRRARGSRRRRRPRITPHDERAGRLVTLAAAFLAVIKLVLA